MKKLIKYFALAGLGIVALTSCNNDDFLDVPQYDILDIESQFAGDEYARRGLNGIYAYNNVSKQDNSWGYKRICLPVATRRWIPSVQVGT